MDTGLAVMSITREQYCLLVPRCESRYMKDSLSHRGSSSWNFVNYNDKEAAASPNFNYLRKRVSAENFFKDFKCNCTSASTTRYKQQNFVYYELLSYLTYSNVK